jgi:hypothetical protein
MFERRLETPNYVGDGRVRAGREPYDALARVV